MHVHNGKHVLHTTKMHNTMCLSFHNNLQIFINISTYLINKHLQISRHVGTLYSLFNCKWVTIRHAVTHCPCTAYSNLCFSIRMLFRSWMFPTFNTLPTKCKQVQKKCTPFVTCKLHCQNKQCKQIAVKLSMDRFTDSYRLWYC